MNTEAIKWEGLSFRMFPNFGRLETANRKVGMKNIILRESEIFCFKISPASSPMESIFIQRIFLARMFGFYILIDKYR